MSSNLLSSSEVRINELNDEIEYNKEIRRINLKEVRDDLKKGLISKNEANMYIRDIKKNISDDNKRLTNIKNNIKKQLKKQNNNVRKILTNFQNSDVDKKLVFTDLTLDEIRFILSNIQKRSNWNTSLLINDIYYTLTDENIEKLKNYSFNIIEMTKESDGKFVEELLDSSNLTIIQERRKRSKPSGAFFPYLNTINVDLSRYGIYNQIDTKNYENNCLYNAIELSGLVNDYQLNSLKSIICMKDVPQSKLKEISNFLGLTIRIKYINNDTNKFRRERKYEIGKSSVDNQNSYHNNIIEIGLIEKHYFLIEKTKYTNYSIKNYEQVKHKNNWWEFIKSDERNKTRTIDSFDLIKLMKELGYFKPIELNTENILKTQYYNKIDKCLTNLNFNANIECRKIETKKSTDYYNGKIFYADFETYKDNKLNLNTAYLCCLVGEGQEKIFRSDNCCNELLNFLPSDSIVYFHNLGFDFSFIVKNIIINKLIKSGSSIKMVSGSYNGKKITFKDSYAFIPAKLEQFSKMFNLDVKKEIMPYELYSEDNISKTTVDFNLALNYIDEKDRKEFIKLSSNYVIGNEFSHMKYAIFYCLQDCRTLKAGFESFRQMAKQEFSLDICNYVSLPSFCYDYGIRYGCFNNCYELSGIPRLFIQKCIVGGRCMTKNNSKYHISDTIINDFDAVSLYPSAMARMGFLQGIPKVIEETNLNLDFLNKQSGYFIEVSDVKINKERSFPLQSNLGIENKSRDFTNNITGNLFLDKYSTEDFIKYQQAEFKIIRGYYFNSDRNYKINEMINQLFNKRKQYKLEKNPTEQVIKLFMNAFYGKTIQKPIEHDLKFKKGKNNHEVFLNYNFNYIEEYNQIDTDSYVYKIRKSINKHFNSVHIGSEILSMSKRIMNEVICCAEDIRCDIYYQDTDSIHITNSDIKRLSTEYNKIYGRELIGKNLGQFHSDFPQDAVAIESYFLGKKSYIDKLITPKGEELLHIRMKGIPNSCIKLDSAMETYNRLFSGEAITFNLSENKFIFKRNKNFSQSINIDFCRTVKF